jgi:transposase
MEFNMDNIITKFSHILKHPDLSHRALAGVLGISHNSIRKYRAILSSYNLGEEELLQFGESGIARLVRGPANHEKIQPIWDEQLIKLQSGLTRQEAYAEFTGSVDGGKIIAYRTYCARIRALRPEPKPTMRLYHPPGHAIMVDYAGYQPEALFENGEPRPVNLFVGTLPNCGMTFACVSWTQSTDDFIWANCEALDYFGGVPRTIIPDNLKAAVLSRPREKPPVFNPVFLALCDHFGMIANPARVKKPKDKGSVEAHVKIVQRAVRISLIRRPTMTLNELNAHIRRLVDGINNLPIRRIVSEKRRVLFEQFEQSCLAPLPASSFEHFRERRIGKLSADYHITEEEVAYSVPSDLIGKPILVRAFRNHIEMWNEGRQVASHARIRERGQRVTLPNHQPPDHRLWSERDRNDLQIWAQTFSDNVKLVAKVEMERKLCGAAKQGQYAGLTRLPREFGHERFEAACDVAVATGKPSLRIVRNLLENARTTGRMPASRRTAALSMPTTNIRGAAYYTNEGAHDA